MRRLETDHRTPNGTMSEGERPRERTRMLAVISTALLLSVLVWFNYSAVLPDVVAAWGLSGTAAGVVFGAFQAGYLLGIVPLGRVTDRRSPRHVVAAGATVTGVASLAFALFADGFLVGTGIRFLAGVGMAGVYVPGMRFVTDWYDPADRGRAMGLYVGTFSVSSGLSFLVSATVAAALDWRVAIAVTSVGALLVGPLVLGFGRDAPGTDERSEGFDRSVLGNRSYLAAVGVYAFHNWELFGVRNWLTAFLASTAALGVTRAPGAFAGTLTGAMILVGGLGNVAGGWLSDRVGRTRVVAVGLCTSAAVSLLLGSLGWLPLPLLVALVLGYGVALTMDSAPTSTTVTEVVADDHVGTALSVQSFVGFLPTVLSPVLFGVVLDEFGYAVAFPVLGVGALCGLGSLAALRRHRFGR